MDVIDSARKSILLAFIALPLVLASITAFLALGLGNLGLFILFLGQLVVIPLATFGLHLISGPAFDWSKIEPSQVASIVPRDYGVERINVTPSYWSMQIVFFISYLITNAAQIYRLPVAAGASDWQVANRRSKALAVICVAAIILFGLLAIRWRLGGQLENPVGLLIALLGGGGLGFLWYAFASACGARASDIFGIIQQILPQTTGTAMTCIYTPS
jgi:hypothetical protein